MYKDAQHAFNALERLDVALSMSWQDKDNFVCFFKAASWHWEISGGIFNQNKHSSEKVDQLLYQVSLAQTDGFKTRKDAVEYAKIFIGPNTVWNANLDKLTSNKSGYWQLPKTSFCFVTNARGKWTIINHTHKNTFPNFKTRKQALQWLVENGQLGLVEIS